MKALIADDFKVLVKHELLGVINVEAVCEDECVCISRSGCKDREDVFINISLPMIHAECAVDKQNEQAEKQAISNNKPIDRYKIKKLLLKELCIDGNLASLFFWFEDWEGNNRIYNGITCTMRRDVFGEYILRYKEPIFYF